MITRERLVTILAAALLGFVFAMAPAAIPGLDLDTACANGSHPGQSGHGGSGGGGGGGGSSGSGASGPGKGDGNGN